MQNESKVREELQEAKYLLAALERVKKERVRRRKEESIRYFEPHPKQAEFLFDKSQTRVVFGGNRSGKTHVSMAEVVAHALGYRPWLSEEDENYRVEVQTPSKGVIVGESFGTAVKDILVPKLLGNPDQGVPGLLPKTALDGKPRRNAQGIITEITLKNGSRLVFMSYDQSVDLFEGGDWDYVAFDEPPPRAIYIALQRGLTDRGGRCWIACTPLKEPWLYDDLVCRDDVPCYTFDLDDNPHISQEAKDQWARNLTDEEKKVRLHGQPLQLEGLIYNGYARKSDSFRIARHKIPSHWPMWCSIDPHPRTKHVAVWGTIRPDGVMLVVGEVQNTDSENRVQPFCDAILSYERDVLECDPERIEGNRIIDPSASTAVDGISLLDRFNDYEIFARPGSKQLMHAINITKDMLHSDAELGIAPRLLFFDDLRGLHHEMMRYSWQEWAGRTRDERNPRDEPRDKDDHFIEAMHRIILDNPQYEPVSFGEILEQQGYYTPVDTEGRGY